MIGRQQKKVFFSKNFCCFPSWKPHHCGGEQFYFILSHPQTLSEEELGWGKVSSPFRLWMMWNRVLMIKILSATIKSCCFFSFLPSLSSHTIRSVIGLLRLRPFTLVYRLRDLFYEIKICSLVVLAQIPLPPTGGGVEWNGILTFRILSRLAFEKRNLLSVATIFCCLIPGA